MGPKGNGGQPPGSAARLSSISNANTSTGAPVFTVPERKIIAIEHPHIIRNLDNGLRLFGPQPNFHRLIGEVAQAQALPLWLRPDNPSSKPIVSHQASTNNILLKITVPKRTGRKRKRGSNESFSSDLDGGLGFSQINGPGQSKVGSVDRQDQPKSLLRKLQDNAGRYEVEAVGMIRDSHRFRGLADFQFANTEAPYLSRVAAHLLPGDVSKVRELTYTGGVTTAPGQEIIPPPHFTDKVIGFNYNYEQNPFIHGDEVDEKGETQLVNRQGRKKLSYGHFIHHDTFPIPQQPKRPTKHAQYRVPDSLLRQMEEAMKRRPLWTRRSLMNQLKGSYTESMIKVAIQLFGYQFRGGPWRDAVVKYGVDPRSDPEYRQYQTLSFKLAKTRVGEAKTPWQTIRKGQYAQYNRNKDFDSHLWDGESYSTDGKFWQLCDVTDPFVRKLIDEAPLRTECDLTECGWYHKGVLTKIKAVMKAKMIAITKDKIGAETDDPHKKGYLYNSFLAERLSIYPDISEKTIVVPLSGLLRPLEELDPTVRSKRRVRASKASTKPAVTSGAGDGSQAEPAPGDSGDDRLPEDDAWGHILDSDLDDAEEEPEGAGLSSDDEREEDEEDEEPAYKRGREAQGGSKPEQQANNDDGMDLTGQTADQD
ncbi:hypothetical protein GGR56DRAFT_107301 [Xylariaceae sp. FL0804]|nr:hypothetical protein GGR56DRAFT_107301 [Xylariaceae sp. FL0804]